METVYQHWWLPRSASTIAPDIDRLFLVVLCVTGAVFFLVQGMLIYLLLRFRRKAGRRARYITGNARLEFLWSAVPAVVLVVLALLSQRVWASIRLMKQPPADAVPVEVLGEQFAWNFRYPGPDGKFGGTDVKLMGADNPFGGIADDSDGKDDIITLNQAYIPVGRPVQIRLRSKDVIHSFFVPEFRYKQDAVPGLTVVFYLTATKAGEYEVACAEFCGLGHYRMKAQLTAGTPEEHSKWLQEQSAAGAQ